MEAVVNGPSEDAKQICLYAIMKYSRLVYEFMIVMMWQLEATPQYRIAQKLSISNRYDYVQSWKM